MSTVWPYVVMLFVLSMAIGPYVLRLMGVN
jgi:hypothetical protein